MDGDADDRRLPGAEVRDRELALDLVVAGGVEGLVVLDDGLVPVEADVAVVGGVDAPAHDVVEADAGLARRLGAEGHVELHRAGAAGSGLDLDLHEERDEVVAGEVATFERLHDAVRLADGPVVVPELRARTEAGGVVVGEWPGSHEVEVDVAPDDVCRERCRERGVPARTREVARARPGAGRRRCGSIIRRCRTAGADSRCRSFLGGSFLGGSSRPQPGACPHAYRHPRRLPRRRRDRFRRHPPVRSASSVRVRTRTAARTT